MNNRWPQIRAVLVGCHVVAVLAMATPSPSAGLRRSSWKDPTVQAELRRGTNAFTRWDSRGPSPRWRTTSGPSRWAGTTRGTSC